VADWPEARRHADLILDKIDRCDCACGQHTYGLMRDSFRLQQDMEYVRTDLAIAGSARQRCRPGGAAHAEGADKDERTAGQPNSSDLVLRPVTCIFSYLTWPRLLSRPCEVPWP